MTLPSLLASTSRTFLPYLSPSRYHVRGDARDRGRFLFSLRRRTPTCSSSPTVEESFFFSSLRDDRRRVRPSFLLRRFALRPTRQLFLLETVVGITRLHS